MNSTRLGQLAAMDVLVRTEPASNQHANARASAEPTDAEIRKIASLVLTQAMMGVEDIAHDAEKRAAGRVEVDLEQVYRAKDRIYIRYSIANRTTRSVPGHDSGCMRSAPDRAAHFARESQESPDQLPDLRGLQSAAGFWHQVMQAESGTRDLAPGEKTTGVISIESSAGNPPQIYQLNFGADQNGPLKVEVVL